MSQNSLKTTIIPIFLQLAKDPIANIRLNAADALDNAYGLLEDEEVMVEIFRLFCDFPRKLSIK